MSRIALAIAVFAVALGPGAEARELEPLDFRVTAATPADFRAQADAVRASLRDGGRHASTPVEQRARIDVLLGSLQAMFDARGSGSALSETDRLQAVNAQNEVNAILARNDDERVICEFVTQTGSHRRSKQCLTVREREARRAEHQDALRETERERGVRGNAS
jgi:hypothetical protein